MPRGRKRGRPRGSKNSVSGGASAAALPNLHMAMDSLQRQRAQIDTQISAVATAIAALSGTAMVSYSAPRAGGTGRGPGRPAGRPPRKGSLKDYILRVMSGGDVMAVKDITSGIMKAGFKTANKTLAKSVGIALTQLKSQVKKVGRGQFKAT